MNPSHIAIRNPASVFILVLMIITMGIYAYRNLPREASPDIQIPLLIVTLPFPGASPQDVEELVTRQAELKLQNVDNLKEMKSISAEGVATITMEFQLGFDVDVARQKVREKLDEARPYLPADVEDPIITEINFSEQPMLIVNLAGDIGLVALKDVADDLKDDIGTIPGILEVDRAGGVEREVHVYANPEKLRYYHVSLSQLASAVAAENTSLPGGTLEMGPTKYLIRTPGEFERPAEINDVVVAAPGGVPVFVRDVARVDFGFQELTSRSRLDGEESVSLVVIKRAGENLLKVRQKVKDMVAAYANRFDGRIRFTILADQGTFVERIVRDLENNIISGFMLVALVLLVAMGLRNALFVATAIPLSFLLTLVAMQLMHFTLNFVVLFSLILALGMLVDNAIVVVENIYRHMQSGKPRVQAAMDGIGEVIVPVTTSTITTLVAFAPVIFMPGIVGEFMTYLPQTLIVALTASLVVALVINPVLCSTLMPVSRKGLGNGDELALVERSGILRAYRRVLHGALRWRLAVLAGTVALFVGIAALYASTTLRRKGVEFFPTTEPNVATISIEAPSGTALAVSDRYVHTVERAIQPFRGSIEHYVSNIGQRQGFGSGQGSSATTHLSYITLQFPDWEHWKEKPNDVVRELRERVRGLPGAEVKVQTQQMGPPTGAPVNIEVRGQSFERMLDVTEEIKRRIKTVPGLINLTDDFDRSRPEIRVVIDREEAARVGLSTREIAQTVRTAFNGSKVSQYRVGKDEYDIVVRLDEPFRAQPADLRALYLQTPAGNQVPLSEVAHITTGPAYGAIRHVKLDRVITVSADAAEGTPGPVVLKRVQQRLSDLPLPESISLKYTGEEQYREEAQTFLEQSFLLALFLIFLVLVTQFNSIATPFIIMSSVVLSLMGVFLGLMIHDLPFSVVMSGIGVISLAGVVVNNAIVLIDFINQLRKRGYACDEAVVLAGMVRMRPVMLTAVTTVLGLVPIAVGMDIDFYRWPNVIVFGGEGGAFWLPMALATIYGLTVATVLTLVIVPVLYYTVDRSKLALAALPGRVSARWSTPAAPSAAAMPNPPAVSGAPPAPAPPAEAPSGDDD